jgi:unsaturated rhamnogalacturonyl hydrolase
MQPRKLFILAASLAALNTLGQRNAPIVLLDYYFNNEWHRTPAGDSVRYHYTWEDKANSGFSKLGDIFKNQGFSLASLATAPGVAGLPTAPGAAALSKASVYIIVDPDIEAENPHPHFISMQDVKVIRDWVTAGGVLVLMGNDKGNAEFQHFNQLAEAFGIHFNEDCVNHVIGNERTPGTIHVQADDPIFKSSLQLYMKDVASLRLTAPATPAIVNNGAVIAATAKVGKGTVFAVGDPWIYNEYIDNHILPAAYQNTEGATAWVSWLKGRIFKRS